MFEYSFALTNDLTNYLLLNKLQNNIESFVIATFLFKIVSLSSFILLVASTNKSNGLTLINYPTILLYMNRCHIYTAMYDCYIRVYSNTDCFIRVLMTALLEYIDPIEYICFKIFVC